MGTVTKSWKLYGLDGHCLIESFSESHIVDLSKNGDTKIFEILNSDTTHTNEYSIVKITLCDSKNHKNELDKQITEGFLSNSNVGIVEEMEFNSWQEVLDKQAKYLQEQFCYHKNAANIGYYFPSYKGILENMGDCTSWYSEFENVAEPFHYTQGEWEKMVSEKFTPIIKKWFEEFCVRNSDVEEFTDYIEKFWG